MTAAALRRSRRCVHGDQLLVRQQLSAELYREEQSSALRQTQASARSTRRDFFERFVDIFEAQLTRIEDRVANSYLLTRTGDALPDRKALDLAGELGGAEWQQAIPSDQQKRRALLASASLHRQRAGPCRASRNRWTSPPTVSVLAAR